MTLQELQSTDYSVPEFKEFEKRLNTDHVFKSFISTTYFKLHDRVLGTCNSSHWDMYIKLKTIEMKDVTDKLKSKFRLATGDIIKSWVGIPTLANSNMTDELALEHLRTNPACISQFVEVPEGWESMIAGGEPKASKPKKEPKVAGGEPKASIAGDEPKKADQMTDTERSENAEQA